jgi:nucleolar protein 12
MCRQIVSIRTYTCTHTHKNLGTFHSELDVVEALFRGLLLFFPSDPFFYHIMSSSSLSLTESIFGPQSATTTPSHIASIFDATAPIHIPKTRKEESATTKKRNSDTQKHSSQEEEEEETSAKTRNKKKTKKSNDDGNDHKEKENVRNDPTDLNASDKEDQKNHEADNDDEEEVNQRTVFVGNLPFSTTRKALAKLFADCGAIQSTRIRNVATTTITAVKLPPEHAGKQHLMKKIAYNTQQFNVDSKQQCVSGYVVFKDPYSVEKALLKNHTPVPDDNGNKNNNNNNVLSHRHIRVDRVQATHDASRSVFVGNLPYQADEESLEAHFLNFLGEPAEDGTSSSNPTDTTRIIENVRIIRDKETHKCKGFGYVLFANATLVARALRYLDGSNYRNREIRVRVCGKRYKNQNDTNKNTTKEKKKRDILDNTVGALQRVLLKSLHSSGGGPSSSSSTKKRLRGSSSSKKKAAARMTNTATGMSKRAAKHAKQTKRTKKLEKRITQGMGKLRK